MKKEKIYKEVMCSVSQCGKTNIHLRLVGGYCGVVKNIVNVQVWETEECVTFVTEDDSKITYPVALIDVYCIMSD